MNDNIGTPITTTSPLEERPLEVGLHEMQADKLGSRAIDDLTPLPFLGVDGYMISRWTHLIAGYPKVGKTELVVALCREWINQDRTILYLTEEPESIWANRVHRYEAHWENVTLGFALGSNPKQIKERLAVAKEDIVVIDTVRNLLQIADENDNSQVSRALAPIVKVARDGGKSLLLVHHTRKMAGDHGSAISGANSFLGIVDVGLEVHRVDNCRNRRAIRGWSRLVEVHDLLIQKDDNGEIVAVGEPGALSIQGVSERLIEVLSDNWCAMRDVSMQLPEPKPSDEQLRRALNRLATDGLVERDPSLTSSVPGMRYQWRLTSNGLSLKMGGKVALVRKGEL